MSFAEVARRVHHPPGRELVVRELCRTSFAAGGAQELCLAATETIRHARVLIAGLDADRRALLGALDAWCVADELVAMVAAARRGVGRG